MVPRKTALAGLIFSLMFYVGCSSNNNSPTTPAASAPSPTLLMNYPGAGLGTTGFLNHGYYIPQYPGSTLSKFVLYLSTIYGSGNNGLYTIQMTALSGNFGGTTIGTSTAYASNLGSGYVPVTFVYGSNPAVAKDSTVMFTPSLITGPDTSLYIDQTSNAFNTLTNQQINLVMSTNTTAPYGTSVFLYGFGWLLYGNP